MHFIADIILAAIIVINTVLGYKRGLVKTVFGLCAVVISVILAYLFGSTAGSLLRATPVYDSLAHSAKENIREYFEEAVDSGTGNLLSDLDENSFVTTAENMGVDINGILSDITLSTTEEAAKAADTVYEKAAEPALKALSNVLGTVIVFILSLILCNILSKVLCGICKLPFLHGINTFGGLVLGFVLGVLYAFVACMILKCLIPCLPENPVLYHGMEKDTLLYGFLSGINPVYIFLFGKILI